MEIFHNDYLLAWSLYLVAALGCLLVWFRATRWMWRGLREPLRLIVAVLLFTPTIVEPEKELFAPAVAITAMDMLLDVGNNAWRAVADLAVYGLIALALYLLLVLVRWPLERKARQRRAAREGERQEDDPRTLRERLEADETEREAPRGRYLRTEPRL
ncbi:MFS transporter [Pseudomonas oligotrophica]|uniref:MFS transporter n=1 Tax=Pseudomonas oligotrophica TaxID=2912055 RepID=UPI001F32DA38|nr:MFS transporter [Pseudomonas oligotrophica]MCF7204070.1 MFS transporter [Pseudomonas oligotrophica]